jgi:hypothetical protein
MDSHRRRHSGAPAPFAAQHPNRFPPDANIEDPGDWPFDPS